MPLSAGADQNQTTSRILNKLGYAMNEIAADITTATTSDIVMMLDASDNYEIKYADSDNIRELIGTTATAAELNYLDIATLGTGAASKAVVLDASGDYTYPSTGTIVYPSGSSLTLQSGSTFDVAGTFEINNVAVTSTAAEVNKLDDSVTVLTAGAGVSAAETNASGYFKNGGIIRTWILVDLTGLVGSATDLDIIGNTGGAASAHFGQITAALNGTIAGGTVTCLEVPAGGADDIDFYSATVSTGAQDVDITTLTETALLTRGAAWVAGDVKPLTGYPTANDYLYIVNGEAVGGTFTAGKFLIELYGV